MSSFIKRVILHKTERLRVLKSRASLEERRPTAARRHTHSRSKTTSAPWTERQAQQPLLSPLGLAPWLAFAYTIAKLWADRSENTHTHTAQTTFVFLHLHSWSEQFGIAQVKILAFALDPSVVRSLLCVSRTDILESCWCSAIALRIAKAVLGKKKSLYVQTTFLHCARQTLRVLRLQKTRTFHRI